MLVEFTRAAEAETEDGILHPLSVAINPDAVGAVLEQNRPGFVIVRMSDGRGFMIRGNYAEVASKINAAMLVKPPSKAKAKQTALPAPSQETQETSDAQAATNTAL